MPPGHHPHGNAPNFKVKMDNVLAVINREFISQPDEEVQTHKLVIDSVFTNFVRRMVDKDPLFNAMYRRIFFEGTFFDDINVGRPEEFDLDVILDLPGESLPVLSESNIPGYAHVHVTNFDGFMRLPEATPEYLNLRSLLDDDFYVTTQNTLSWMQEVVQKTLKELPSREGAYLLQIDIGLFEIRIKRARKSPAMTLRISGEGLNLDVNLVGCFVFRGNCWPLRGYKSNPYPNNWFPKCPNTGMTNRLIGTGGCLSRNKKGLC